MGAVREIRRQGVRPVAVLAILAGSILVAVPAAPAAARPSSKPKLALKLATATQRGLVNTDSFDVSVRTRRNGARIRLATTLEQGGKTATIAHRESLRLGGGSSKSATIDLNPTGRSLVQSCLTTRLRVIAQVRFKGHWRKAGVAVRTVSRDPKLCQGKTPVGVDVADAPKCDPIAPTDAGECLFPYPNDYYTRSDPGTDTGKRLDLAPDADPGQRQRRPQSIRPRSTPATASAPARRWSSAFPAWIPRPRSRTPDPVPITEHGRVRRRKRADRRHRRRHRRAPADLDRARLQRLDPGRHRPADPLGHATCSTATATSSPCAISRTPTARRSRRRQGSGSTATGSRPRSRRSRSVATTSRTSSPSSKAAGHRPRQPLHGLGLHRRQHREHDRADAAHPRRRPRRPRRHDSDRRRHRRRLAATTRSPT